MTYEIIVDLFLFFLDPLNPVSSAVLVSALVPETEALPAAIALLSSGTYVGGCCVSLGATIQELLIIGKALHCLSAYSHTGIDRTNISMGTA